MSQVRKTQSPKTSSVNRGTARLQKSLAASLTAGVLFASTVGCSSGPPSLSSLNPFAKNDSPTTIKSPESHANSPSMTESFVDSTKGAMTKSRDTVTGWFKGDDSKPTTENKTVSAPDPLRLDRESEVSPASFIANGRFWESTGNFEKAMASYAKALEKSPNHPDALTMIGRLHFRQGNHEQAADFFGKAIKEKPDDAGLYNDLGITLCRLGNHEVATQSLQKALELSPGTPRYANSLASIRFDAGDPVGAHQVLAKNNKPAVAHFNMAYLHYRKGQMQQAADQLSRAMQYKNHAPGDKATEHAISRSQELLAQLQGPTSPTPGVAIAQSNNATQPGTSPQTQPLGVKTDSSGFTVLGGTTATNNPLFRQASQTLSQSTTDQSDISNGSTSVPTYSCASYRMPPTGDCIPSGDIGTNSSGEQACEGDACETPPTSSTPTSGSPMMLPKGFDIQGL